MKNIREEIERLKRERRAVILAHNYQLPEVQDVADYVGDSLGLSRQAAKTSAALIVFCGVYFMAETAKILSPEKTVVIPDKHAGCPLAAMITPEQVRALKKEHPGARVLCYVNSSAAVKAECDICCTSANATQIAERAFGPDEQIIFVPDKYLAAHVAAHVQRDIIIWKGYCPTHARILPEQIQEQRRLHPQANVLVHPECRPAVTALADAVLSTGGMSAYVAKSSATEFIIGTEVEMLYRLRQDNPEKRFYPASVQAGCPNMKKITLEKVLRSLHCLQDEVTVAEQISARARASIQEMIRYS